MRVLELFAGGGGGVLASRMLGHRVVCAVERDPYCREILMRRQEDGELDPFPIWDDVRTFDGRPWRGLVDVVSGGFPCQPFSVAGKQRGEDDERNLWPEMRLIIGEVGPRYVFGENVPGLVRQYLPRVLGDLAELGFDAEWGVLGADDVGAPHRRKRLWILASNANGGGFQGERSDGVFDRKRSAFGDDPHGCSVQGWGAVSDTDRDHLRLEQRRGEAGTTEAEPRHDGSEEPLADPANPEPERGRDRSRRRSASAVDAELRSGARQWETEPDVGRVVDGVAARVDRLRALGNGQVPQCYAEAWRQLWKRLNE